MKISNRQLINLPAVTQSGQDLGIVEDFNIDIESQSVLEYKVKPSSLVRELITGDLVIPRGQIVDITKSNLIVKDSFSNHEPFKALAKLSEKGKESVVLNKE